jgi:hypothetical protein
MQTANANSPATQRRWFLSVWVQVLVMATILTCFRVQDYRHMRDAWNVFQVASARLQAIDYTAAQQINSFNRAILATQHRRVTLPELVQKFNGGRDFPKSGNDLCYVDPISGGRATLSLFPDNTLALVDPDSNRPGPSAIPDPSIAPLVVAFFASIVGCLVLLGLYIRTSQNWAEQSRQQRIKSGWNLVAVGVTIVYLGWLGSKFFPSWRPFGDAQLLGFEAVFASSSLMFIFWAYLSGGPSDSTPRCHQCRYDLTGNVSGTCPECGTAIRLGKNEFSSL